MSNEVNTFDAMYALIGRRVEVIIYRDEGISKTGILRALAEDGEATLETETGMEYCWPALGMIEIDAER